MSDADIVGYAALSWLTRPERCLALAPVAVRPDCQRRGIGAQLVGAALDKARQGGAAMVFILGDPDYYRRFGFTTDAATGFASPYAGPYFQALRLAETAEKFGPQTDVVFAPAFALFD
jgi:putative acetyltransferase